MKKIGDTELIINNENRIYHLNLKKEEVADKDEIPEFIEKKIKSA